MTVTATPVYGAVTSLTWTLNSLATDSTLLIGRASTAIDNTTDLAIDALVGGQFVTHSVAPTAAKQIEVWAFGSFDGTAYNAGASGTDAALTVTAETKTLMRLLSILPTGTGASLTYTWGPFSIAQAFGGLMPRKWGLWTVQNTGQILNAAGNLAKYTPVKVQSA
jgi:hypothetical protein